MTQTQATSSDQETRHLRDLAVRIWQYRRLIVICASLSTVGFILAAFLLTPTYRASVVMISAGGDRRSLSRSLGSAFGQLEGLTSLAGISVGGADEGTQESLAVLRSRDFSERFIKDKNLLPVLFPKKWDATQGKWNTTVDKQPTFAQAFKYFNERIRSIVEDKKTNLVTLQIDWKDRSAAASWANELVDRLNAEMRDRALSNAGASLEYLERELSQTNETAARESISKLIETQIQQRMLANVSREYAFRVVDKAMVPDPKEVLSPNKPLLVISGPIIGFFVGFILAGLARSLSRGDKDR